MKIIIYLKSSLLFLFYNSYLHYKLININKTYKYNIMFNDLNDSLLLKATYIFISFLSCGITIPIRRYIIRKITIISS